jgi:hypothetical protein
LLVKSPDSKPISNLFFWLTVVSEY